MRPILEYASSVWSHYLKKKVKLEQRQRRATKLIPSLAELSYTDRLKKIGTAFSRLPQRSTRSHTSISVALRRLEQGDAKERLRSPSIFLYAYMYNFTHTSEPTQIEGWGYLSTKSNSKPLIINKGCNKKHLKYECIFPFTDRFTQDEKVNIIWSSWTSLVSECLTFIDGNFLFKDIVGGNNKGEKSPSWYNRSFPVDFRDTHV